MYEGHKCARTVCPEKVASLQADNVLFSNWRLPANGSRARLLITASPTGQSSHSQGGCKSGKCRYIA